MVESTLKLSNSDVAPHEPSQKGSAEIKTDNSLSVEALDANKAAKCLFKGFFFPSLTHISCFLDISNRFINIHKLYKTSKPVCD